MQSHLSRVPAAPQGLIAPSSAALQVALVAALPLDEILTGMVGAGLGIEAICLFLGLSRSVLDASIVRLNLRTPPNTSLRPPGPKGWSVGDVMRLIAWRVAAIHPDTIGLRLGRSANGVRSKARRLGLPLPSRKALRRVDPHTLPDPPGAAAASPSPPAAGPVSQRMLPVFGIVRDWRPPVQAPAPQAAAAPVAPVAPSDLAWIGQLRRTDRDEAAVKALSMRYFGGQHYKATARDAGMTEAALRSLLSRIQLPRDHDRSKFGPTWDEECARATLERSGYVLQRDISFPDWAEEKRPLFWRHKTDRVRTSRATRFRNGHLGEWDKHKGQTITLVTRDDLRRPTFPLSGGSAGKPGIVRQPVPPFAGRPATMHS